MSKRKRGGGADEIYNTHLFGANGRFASNQGMVQELQIQRTIERTMTEMAINRFRWDGLEETGIDPRFLEMCLFYNGLAVVYWDEDFDKLIAVRGTGTGYVNMLDNPVSFTVIGPGSIVKPTTDTAPAQFRNKTLSAYQPTSDKDKSDAEKRRKAIGVWPNALRYPDIDIVKLYSKRLASIDRTIDINVKNTRHTKVLRGSPNAQLSMINFNRQVDEGSEILQVTGPLQDMEFITAIDLGVTPESYEKAHILRTRLWNEAMNLLGIDNANQDKKERLVAAEVTANDEQTDNMKLVNLHARRYAASLINDVFGTNISVDYATVAEQKEVQDEAADREMQIQNNAQNNDNKEDDENGNIHDEGK